MHQSSFRKTNILNLTRSELRKWLIDLGAKSFNADQLFRWLHKQGERSLDRMSNLSQKVKTILEEAAVLPSLEPTQKQSSSDGTTKVTLTLTGGDKIEAVLMPREKRVTACVSSQVGCALGCTFCLTATMGFKRNLEIWEIVEQVRALNLLTERPITNIVFMGMGEPLLNLDNVAGAIHILTDDLGLSLSHRKITVSTAGMANKLQEFSKKVQANLAVSLNATTDAGRTRLMPINQKYDLNRLLAELAAFPLATRKRITFEYIMLDGINDQKEDARRLIKLLHGLRFKINLIPYNGYSGSPYKSSTEEQISAFQKILLDKNINTIVRHSRGQDILAACGQLALNKTL